ncbi:Endoribonuclease L-PSP superfamily [Synechococcus sp. PCC 7335]|uniref:RidA family protein n=1 Tax=Synechococcus sp. (strain ATCC 29403 / PCC 7335) TaxID=91464 RepID=UPI00017EDCC9|nr:RidA family protein [Synechococcus sp. PCC 7335]EDX83730.1 Endoribonuclease L-PSP superfamily [Synechococcus sp. PCC 7335]
MVQRHFTDTEWEPRVGYCRALRAGKTIYLSGTAPIATDGSTFAPGHAYAQACRCFEIIRDTLAAMDAGLHQVVRTRMYVTDISQWEAFGKAHQEFFGEHPPVTAMVEVKGLINPDMLIEVEAEAFTEG